MNRKPTLAKRVNNFINKATGGRFDIIKGHSPLPKKLKRGKSPKSHGE